MHEPAAPSPRVGAKTTIRWRDDTVVPTVLECFDTLWAQAQWVAASDRLVAELAIVDLITAMRANRRGLTIHIVLEADELQVSASLTHAGTAAAPTGTELANRCGLGERVTYRHAPSGGVAHITHDLRRPVSNATHGAGVRNETVVGCLDAVHALTRTSRRSNIKIGRTGVALPVTDPAPRTVARSPGIEATGSPRRR